MQQSILFEERMGDFFGEFDSAQVYIDNLLILSTGNLDARDALYGRV